MKIDELQKKVTDQIIAQLEGGTAPWVRPWTGGNTGGGIMPRNYSTGVEYKGINVLILWCEAMKQGYPRHEWMTYNQAKRMGAGPTGIAGSSEPPPYQRRRTP